MTAQNGKNLVVPIQSEIERLAQIVSENEKRTNPRLMKKLGKLRYKLLQLREILAPRRLKFAGAV